MNWCAPRRRARAVGVVVAIVAVAMLFQAEPVSAAFHAEVIDQVDDQLRR